MNPIEVIISWQGFVLAVGISVTVQGIKRTLDIFWGRAEIRRLSDRPPRMPHEAPSLPPELVGKKPHEVGRQKRKGRVFVNRVLFPALPIVLGSVAATLVPVHPEALLAYISAHVTEGQEWLVFSSWGGVVGAFADYLYSKVKAAMQEMRAPTI